MDKQDAATGDEAAWLDLVTALAVAWAQPDDSAERREDYGDRLLAAARAVARNT